jgi:hypothetical protein
MTTWVRPTPPASPRSLGEAWHDAERSMPTGRWISLNSEYGPTARWIASAVAPHEFDPFDAMGNPGGSPEQVLNRLSKAVRRQNLETSMPPGLSAPSMSASADALASAWQAAVDALPGGWWITGVSGFEGGRPGPSGWHAFAAGGPDDGYDGEQGLGSTPEGALEELARVLRGR